MPFHQLFAISALVVPCMLVNFKPTQIHRKVEKPPEKAMRQVQEAKSFAEISQGYLDLFTNCSSEEIDRLVSCIDRNVAIPAAWERVRRTIPKTFSDELIAIDKSAVAQFLGLVEGITRVPLPLNWERSVRSVKYYERGNILFGSPFEEVQETDGIGKSPKITPPAELFLKENVWVLKVNNREWIIQNHNDTSFHNVKVAFVEDEERAYAVLYSDVRRKHSLYIIDKKNNRVHLAANLFAAGSIAGTGRPSHELVELRLCGDELVIFGVDRSCIFIECFDTNSNKALFRFCSRFFKSNE